MGLKVKKWLTNSQFELREESYFFKKNLSSGLKIINYFHLYLIQLWWQFFQNFVYGDVVYAQT